MTISLSGYNTFTLEEAMGELEQWAKIETSRFGDDKFIQVIDKVKLAAQGLQTIEMDLHFQCFRFGFDFFYGKKADAVKYTPISALEGHVMKWHIMKKQDCHWPIKDHLTNAYFIAIVSKESFKEHAPPSGSTPTDQYIEYLINIPTEENGRILEALTPYAKFIKESVGNSLYRRIKQTCPNYPE